MIVLTNLDRIAARAAESDVRAVLHPRGHHRGDGPGGAARPRGPDDLALPRHGHLLIGGTDPAALTRQAPDRIVHTHLKDVDDTVVDKVRSGRLTYYEAVVEGMYRPLGTGDVDVAAIVETLEAEGYAGWYNLEKDTVLIEEPRGEGPLRDVRISADYVRSLLQGNASTPTGGRDER